MDELQNKVDVELNRALEGLSELDVDSKEYGEAANSFEKLYRMRMDEQKNDADYWLRHEADKQNRVEQRRDKIIGYIFDGMKLTGYAGLFILGLKFEENGALTSIFVKNHDSKMKLL